MGEPSAEEISKSPPAIGDASSNIRLEATPSSSPKSSAGILGKLYGYVVSASSSPVAASKNASDQQNQTVCCLFQSCAVLEHWMTQECVNVADDVDLRLFMID